MAATAAVSAIQPVPGIPEAASIRLSGVFTRDEAAALRRRLLDRLARTEGPKLVLSLADVEKMDTSGAAVLAEVIKRGHERHMRILLCSPSQAVRQVFELAGFPEVLSTCCAHPEETRERLLA